MSDAASFAKFVPGFDFLQNLSKGTSSPMPGVSSWVAPTLDPEELEKRITDLKAVLFWLEQNTTALKATIQALEVQKMTLATLKSMNMDMGAMAKAFQFPDFSAAAKAPQEAASPAQARAPTSAEQPVKSKPAPSATKPSAEQATDQAAANTASPHLDPLQLWGSLTQQFQQIATQALQEVSKAQTPSAVSKTASPKAASKKASTSTAQKPATKKAAKKPAAKRSTTRQST
jgi:hypothetical protein